MYVFYLYARTVCGLLQAVSVSECILSNCFECPSVAGAGAVDGLKTGIKN